MKDEKVVNIKLMITAIICICLFVIGLVPRGLQNDTFYTIKLGELILENGVDMQEHFAWHEGLTYTYPHWLYDVIMYLIYAVSGFYGIYISSIVFGCLLGITIYLTNVKLTKNAVVPFLTTILIMFVGKEFITARAQLITFILFVLTIYCIERFLETKKKRFAIGLLLISTTIANVHAAVFPFYFVLYLPYIGEYYVSFLLNNKDILTKLFLKSDERKIKKLEENKDLDEKQLEELEVIKNRVEKNKIRLEEEKKNPKEPYKIIVEYNKNFKWLLLVMILAALTGLLTPIGDTPYTYLYNTMKGTTTNNITEHMPIILYNAKYVFIYISITICLISFSRVKIKLSDLFLIGGLMFLTIMSRRQQSMLLFVGILVVNRILANILARYDQNGINEFLRYMTSIVSRIIIYAIFVTFAIMALNKTKNASIVSEREYPVKAAEYIKENLDVENIKLFNEYNFGSYLLFKDIPVFIDSRADVYDPAFNGWKDDIFRDFINLTNGANNYEQKLEHYGITHLLIYRNSTLEKVLKLSSNYQKLYSDNRFIIYERLSAK